MVLKNYLTIAYRNLKKYKGYSFINIIALVVGLACAIMILIFVQFELSYDRFHEKQGRIYRVGMNAMFGDTRIEAAFTPAILTRTLYQNYPEVETSIRLHSEQGLEVRKDEQIFHEYRVASSDPEFFLMFSFPLISGEAESVLKEPNSVVLSLSTVQKYFGNKDPVGQKLFIGQKAYRVTGVMADMPPNSHFHFDMILSIVTFDRINSTEWMACDYRTYILLHEGVSWKEFEAKLPDLVSRYMFRKGNYDKWAQKGNFWEFYLQPLPSIHLHSNLNGEFEANGNAAYAAIFFIIAIFILLVAGANYMNLSTARSANRAREVGIRKVMGATRGLLKRQFLSESILVSLIALILAIGLVHLLLPLFGNMVQRQLMVPYRAVPWLVPGLLGLAVGIGTLSGAYPSFFLSAFQPVTVLQGRMGSASKNTPLRHAMVFFQFSISIALLIGTGIVQQQLNFFMNKDIGFSKEQVIIVKTPNSLNEQSESFKEALRQNPTILEVSGSYALPGQMFNRSKFKPEGLDQNILLTVCLCEPEFKDVIQLQMAKGRFFSREFGTDRTAVILNQKAADILGWKEPIGKTIISGGGSQFHVIGVVQDYHYESLHQTVRPAALFLLNGALNWLSENFISLRVQTGNLSGTLDYLKSSWDLFNTDIPLEYTFLDDEYAALYENEQRTGRLFLVFSGLAIFIACLGLFGLASFTVEQYTKEIGIRKVLGASLLRIFMLLTRGFTKWVILANILAWPVAYLFMNKWLQNFAYRIDISVGTFLLAAALALIIALLTVSWQTIRAACANPVESLKYE